MVTLRLPSQFGYEKVAMVSAAVIAKRMGFTPERVEDIKTVIAEACINAIEHGNGLDTSTPVIVELEENSHGLEVNVSDTGRSHIPSPLPSPGDSLCHRGWGMFLIQSLVDEFDFGLTPQGGNYLRMRLKRAHC